MTPYERSEIARKAGAKGAAARWGSAEVRSKRPRRTKGRERRAGDMTLSIRERKPKDLRQAAKHVSYEMEMLMFAGGELGGWHSSPMSKPAGNYENMALESFLLHFRNLRGFLCPTLQKACPDDICASHFLGKPEAADVGDKKTLEVLKERLDKMLAHLSYTREVFIEAREHAWPVARMSVELLEQLEIFLGQLSPERRSWFPSNEQISNRKSEALSFLNDSNPA
jgi:hypothetical protein